jgi:hypothetical protein
MLDFSEWASQPPSADQRMLICDAVSDGRMPPSSPAYTARNRKRNDGNSRRAALR